MQRDILNWLAYKSTPFTFHVLAKLISETIVPVCGI